MVSSKPPAKRKPARRRLTLAEEIAKIGRKIPKGRAAFPKDGARNLDH